MELRRRADGVWAEPLPVCCGHGMRPGWKHCSCRAVSDGRTGHRDWHCASCGRRLVDGCERPDEPVFHDYGCR